MGEVKTVEEMVNSTDINKRELLDKLEYECKEIDRKIIDTNRWSYTEDFVVLEKDTGKYYSYSLNQPATECQDFDIESDFYFCGEVKPVTKMVEITTYEPVKK